MWSRVGSHVERLDCPCREVSRLSWDWNLRPFSRDLLLREAYRLTSPNTASEQPRRRNDQEPPGRFGRLEVKAVDPQRVEVAGTKPLWSKKPSHGAKG